MYPTVTGATDRCMIPLLILPGCPLQEPFTGIDDMNSTEAWKLRRLLIWKQEDSIATRVEWKVEKPRNQQVVIFECMVCMLNTLNYVENIS